MWDQQFASPARVEGLRTVVAADAQDGVGVGTRGPLRVHARARRSSLAQRRAAVDLGGARARAVHPDLNRVKTRPDAGERRAGTASRSDAHSFPAPGIGIGAAS